MEEDYLIAQTLLRHANELQDIHNKTKGTTEKIIIRHLIRGTVEDANTIMELSRGGTLLVNVCSNQGESWDR